MSLSWTWLTFLVVLLFAVLWMDQRRPSGSHTLCYSFSLLSKPLPGAPLYSVVGHVNDVVIISYTSESGIVGPRAPWMEKITDKEPKYWDDSRETFEEVKKKLSDTLRKQMEQNNQSPGLHVFQAMLGCELREDESVKWFERYAYDGSNYTSNLDPAAETQDQGNSEESFECMKELKQLLHYGENSLRRRVTPRTMVSQRKAKNHTFLFGYAYGFYPRDIDVKWVRDGVEIPWESRELLPNPDGTYQVRTTLEVQEGDDVKSYEYHVNHSSLPVTVVVKYGPHGRSGQGRLVLVASLMAVLVGAAVILWKPLKRFFTSEDREQRSNEAKTSGGENEGVEMVPLQRDTAGPSTGSDSRSSVCKGS